MMIKKEKHCRESVIVVLDWIRASTEKTGVAPLRCALRDLVGPEDEILVITILNSEANTPSPTASFCCLGEMKSNHPGEGDRDIKFLHEEISPKMEAYEKIFAPYYDRCRSSGVKFHVKIAASFQPDILVGEANNVKATWIVMDRLFSMDQSFILSGTNCNISSVREDEDTIMYNYSPGGLEKKERNPNPKFSNLNKRSSSSSSQDETHAHCTLPNFQGKYQHVSPSDFASTSRGLEILAICDSLDERENLEKVELESEGIALHDNISSNEVSKVKLMSKMPLQLSWEVISEITGGFGSTICIDQNDYVGTYRGYITDCCTNVMVKRFSGDFSGILETEKRAALSMHHNNIMGLIGYHKSENDTILVFPHPARGTLDRYLHAAIGADSRGTWKEFLTFQDKMKIATGTGKGVRYMHEECPRGPIVHGDLQPCNIFLTSDFKPLITGFGRAKWLQLGQQTSPISSNRGGSHKDPLDVESLTLVKSDILSFGILLLRLFCRKSAPKDGKKLIEWAQPLLRQRAYHELLDEDTEYLDMHGILKVVCAAIQCTKTRPVSRPCMSEEKVLVLCNQRHLQRAAQLCPRTHGSTVFYCSLCAIFAAIVKV
ncbi:G-type lectin S-receptor-like serine/threonine-protein kinase At1g34300 [Cornus florida]|uniref:G-type lectin S-receptor-like serine/threonine-protein kinase At1g34300 n=1 Tax=Cornus florida TaxID=4283 RepID=UPI00289E9FBD|nr:G-type lectin S-receptor-like serine/threonine-protein kinase At1g34300 [Cornus florida]